MSESGQTTIYNTLTFAKYTHQTLLLQLCSSLGLQELETHQTPKRTVMATEQRGRSTVSHLALAPTPSVLTPSPNKVTALSAP